MSDLILARAFGHISVILTADLKDKEKLRRIAAVIAAADKKIEEELS
jgi:hypothetical protein